MKSGVPKSKSASTSNRTQPFQPGTATTPYHGRTNWDAHVSWITEQVAGNLLWRKQTSAWKKKSGGNA